MADSQEPRLLHVLLDTCDDCPCRQYDGHYGMSHDAGWDCQHPEGGFRIANEGSTQVMHDCGPSVVARIGKNFPDKCPLGARDQCNNDPEIRSRSIELDAPVDMEPPNPV